MSYKLERGLKEVRYHDIYDTWVKILMERGVYHPIWNQEDMEFVKNMISGNDVPRMLLEEILSFRTEQLAFFWQSHLTNASWADWMKWMVASVATTYRYKNSTQSTGS